MTIDEMKEKLTNDLILLKIQQVTNEEIRLLVDNLIPSKVNYLEEVIYKKLYLRFKDILKQILEKKKKGGINNKWQQDGND